MTPLINMLLASNTAVGKYGPKFAAVGILLVMVGEILQGHFDKFDSNTAIEAMIALGLWGSRANYRSSQDVGVRPKDNANA